MIDQRSVEGVLPGTQWIIRSSNPVGNPISPKALPSPSRTQGNHGYFKRRSCDEPRNHPRRIDPCLHLLKLGETSVRHELTSLLALSILALLAACRPAAEPPAPEIRPVRVMTVAKTAGGETVSLTGNVQAQTEVNLSFRIDGRMIQRNVDVGGTIKPGQVVATLNSDNEENALQSARASLTAARAQLVEARNNYERYKTLLAQRSVAEAEFDRFAAILKTAQSQVDSAQAQVNIAQNRLGYAQLVADAGGTVTAVGAEPGEVVQAGRMIVQVARQAGRDAVFDVSPQIKDRAPANPEITVFLTTDPR